MRRPEHINQPLARVLHAILSRQDKVKVDQFLAEMRNGHSANNHKRGEE